MGHTQQLAPVFFLMDEIADEMLQDRCHPVGIEVIDDDPVSDVDASLLSGTTEEGADDFDDAD